MDMSPLRSSSPSIKSSSTAALLSCNQIHTQPNNPFETLIGYVVSFKHEPLDKEFKLENNFSKIVELNVMDDGTT